MEARMMTMTPKTSKLKRKKKRSKSLPTNSPFLFGQGSKLCCCPNGSVRRTTGYSLRPVCTECRRTIISPPPLDYSHSMFTSSLPRDHTPASGFPLSFETNTPLPSAIASGSLHTSQSLYRLPPLSEYNPSQSSSDRKSRSSGNLFSAIKPTNQDTERDRFFKSKYATSPQFSYKSHPEPDSLRKYNHPSADLLDFAVLILSNTLKRHGTYEKFERVSGGRILTKQETMDMARDYLKREKLDDKVFINLSEDLVSRGSMTKVKGRPTLNIRYENVREHFAAGLLRHEVGTHYLRSSNNRFQIWSDSRKRTDLEMGPINPTEEGLASLHSVLDRRDPCLWRAALLYYTAYKAAFMSFVELFQDLSRFVKDPHVRWDYCLRSKRGMTDTSKVGTFCKDQVYLTGALQLLKRRRTLDFQALVRLGKVSYKDVERLKPLADFTETKLPGFMQDEALYKIYLDRIVKCNGLSDYLLEKIS